MSALHLLDVFEHLLLGELDRRIPVADFFFHLAEVDSCLRGRSFLGLAENLLTALQPEAIAFLRLSCKAIDHGLHRLKLEILFLKL